MKILLKQHRGIGDLVIAFAFAHALKKRYPMALVVWDVCPAHSDLLTFFQHRVFHPQDKVDFIVDFNRSVSTRNFTLHEVERYCRAWPLLMVNLNDVAYPVIERSTVAHHVVLSLGARISTRQWTVSGYQSLLDELTISGYRVTLIGGIESIAIAAALNIASTVNNVVGKLSLLQTCEQIQSAEAVIANDTGIAHIAAAMGVPLLVFTFNKVQNNFRWSPWTENAYVIRGAHDCSRICHSSECNQNECRDALSIPQALLAWKDFIAGKRNGKNKRELAKNSLFIGMMMSDALYDSLKTEGYSVFLFSQAQSLKSFTITHNINVWINPLGSHWVFNLKQIYLSNFVSEFPLVIRTEAQTAATFLSEFFMYAESL